MSDHRPLTGHWEGRECVVERVFQIIEHKGGRNVPDDLARGLDGVRFVSHDACRFGAEVAPTPLVDARATAGAGETIWRLGAPRL